MNITKKCIILIILTVFSINSAFGFPGYKANNTSIPQDMGIVSQIDLNNTTTPQDVGPARQMDLNNTTASDQDIVLVQHLMEVDAVQLQPENKLFIKETLIFRNIGTKDFFGSLRTWLPDDVENIMLSRSEMMTTGEIIPLGFNRTGNDINWQDYVEQNSKLPFLYVVEYNVKTEGTPSNTGKYSKILDYYPYSEKSGLAAIVVKINKSADSSVKFLDENGNIITPTTSEENGNINRFSSPQFKEINLEFSKSEVSKSSAEGTQSYAVYIVLGILIILALLYPVIMKKLKQGENGEETEETSGAETPEEIPEKKSRSVDISGPSGEEFKGKSKTELENLRKEFQLKLKELETEYKSGNLLDEEYEDSRNTYQNKLKSINARLK